MGFRNKCCYSCVRVRRRSRGLCCGWLLWGLLAILYLCLLLLFPFWVIGMSVTALLVFCLCKRC